MNSEKIRMWLLCCSKINSRSFGRDNIEHDVVLTESLFVFPWKSSQKKDFKIILQK
jgi:hypothetical protein